MSNCWCYECLKDVPAFPGAKHFMASASRMILCPTCGNKRCPHATDHRLACTDSNDPNQLGSKYGIYPHPALPLLDFLNSKNDSIS